MVNNSLVFDRLASLQAGSYPPGHCFSRVLAVLGIRPYCLSVFFSNASSHVNLVNFKEVIVKVMEGVGSIVESPEVLIVHLVECKSG